MIDAPTVFIIDDDEPLRDALKRLFRSVGLSAEVFASAPEFLKYDRPDVPSCLVLDVRLPGLSGLDFQAELGNASILIPIVFITGHGDIPMSVKAMKAGAVDKATSDLASAVEGADLVILCTPLAQMRLLAEQILPSLKRGAIVTDVGSVKGSVVQELEPLIASAGASFVGSHPMAGAEKTGVSAARADLFQNAICVVTQTPKTPSPAISIFSANTASGATMFTRTSVHCAERIVATRSSKGFLWSSAHFASG
jgi:CheY-like chemotaxis protein